MKVAIDHIRVDGGTQSRAIMDDVIIDQYAADMQDGCEFPPIIVFKGDGGLWLADGFHRFYAAKESGLDIVEADVKKGSQRDAILFAAGANAEHGQPRDDQDKEQAVTLLLDDDEWYRWSDRQVAQQCKVSHPFVAKVRKAVDARREMVSKKRQQAVGSTGNGFQSDAGSGTSGHECSQVNQPEQVVRKCADGRIINVANIGKKSGNKQVKVEVVESDAPCTIEATVRVNPDDPPPPTESKAVSKVKTLCRQLSRDDLQVLKDWLEECMS